VGKYCTAVKVTDNNVICNAVCVPKATNTHSIYEKLIALALQQWMQEITSILRHAYISYLVKIILDGQTLIIV
jgi:hypothetical protein